MVALRTLRWTLSHLLRDPLVWLCVVVTAAAWPWIAALTPVGLTTSARSPAGQLYEIAFWSGLVGAISGLAVVGRGAWFLAPLPTLRRLEVESTGLFAASGSFVLAALGTAGLLGAPLHAALLLGTVAALAHLTALGLVLLRTPLGTAGRAIALVLLAWLVPGLLEGAGTLGAALAPITAVPRHLAFPSQADPAGTHGLTALLPILGLALLAALTPPNHALRRSR